MASGESSPIIEQFSINYKEFDEKEAFRIFRKYGVCVVKNAFSDEYCDEKVNEIVSFFEGLGTGIDRRDETTFDGKKVPIETKPGMFHCLIGNLPAVWEIRKSQVVRRCFSALYQYDGKFIVSSDGLTVTPNRAYPQPADWPHLDQTVEGTFKCIQGQAVLTNTSASFICSPKSHLLLEEILALYQANVPNNFLRLDGRAKKCKEIQKRVKEVGGIWQIPIVVPKGSLIFWASSMIHSARPTVVKEDSAESDPWKGWRCAVYVCYRPVTDFTPEEIGKRAECVLKNRQTNHWSTRIMSKRSQGRANRKETKHPVIEQLLEEPLRVYKYIEKPSLEDPVIRELSGVEFCENTDGRVLSMMDVYNDPNLSLDAKIDKLAKF